MTPEEVYKRIVVIASQAEITEADCIEIAMLVGNLTLDEQWQLMFLLEPNDDYLREFHHDLQCTRALVGALR